jgi:peptidoglycan/LPS O-acetylase OafA/YrhL
MAANIIVLVSLFGALIAVYFLHNGMWIEVADASKRVGNLDGLRGYLAFAVVINHFHNWLYYIRGVAWTQAGLADYVHHDVVTLGSEAVAIFFMITGVLFYNKIIDKSDSRDWARFYVNRFFRLAPVLWFAVLLLVCVAAMQSQRSGYHSAAENVLGVLKWMSFFGTPDLFNHTSTDVIVAKVTWTLKYEWFYYFSLPALALMYAVFSKACTNKFVLIVGVGSVCMAAIFCVQMAATYFVGSSRLGYYVFPLFFFGMVAYELSRLEKVRNILCSPMMAAAGLVALLIEAAVVSYDMLALRYVLLFVAFAPVVAGNGYWGLLKSPISIAFGSITYCMYLLHGIVLYVFMNFYRGLGARLEDLLYFFPLVSVLVVLISTFTHYYVETPGIALGRRLAEKIFRPVAAPGR